MTGFPRFHQVVLDCLAPRPLAEFYRELLGYTYRAGDEAEAGQDWLVLIGPQGQRIAFQQTDELPPSTWPDPAVPQQLHLDLSVPTVDELREQHDRAIGLGARLLLDEIDDPEEALRVYADPAGHPFCIFVAPDRA